MWKFIKRFFIFLFMISIILIIRYDERIFPRYKIIDKDKIFASYSMGNVYIGDDKFLSGLSNLNKDDVLVLDKRDENDPTLKIISSYKIVDNNLQNEILHILKFDYKIERTEDVDLNNNDEDAYSKDALKDTIKKIIKKILNRLK